MTTDLSKVESRELILELQSRGYYTNLLYSREDVKFNLKDVNETNESNIVLVEYQMDEILEQINDGWINEVVNETIYNTIVNDYLDNG